MGAWVRGAGVVGGEDADQAVVAVDDEPDETVAEHGICGGEEVGFERLERGGGGVDFVKEGLGWLCLFRRLNVARGGQYGGP